MPQQTDYNDQSSSANAVCTIRTSLLDRLAGAVESLGQAKLHLKVSVATGDFTRSQSIGIEVESLRKNCCRIRVELEYHRANHGC
jgi:hypothetical protein